MKWLKKIGAALVVFYLVLWSITWIASPPLTRMLLGDLLTSYQLDLDENSSVRLNLFLSCLTVEDLKWRRSPMPGVSEQETFQLKELEACYSLHRLIFKEAQLKSLELTGLKTEVKLGDQGIEIAGFQLPQGRDAAVEPEPETEEPAKPLPLILSAPKVRLNDVEVQIIHQGQPHLLAIHQLKALNSRFENEVLNSTLNLGLNLNQAELKLQAEVHYQPETAELQLELALTEFDPRNYLYLLPENIQTLNAQVDLATKVKVLLKGSELQLLSESSSLSLEEVNYADDLVQASLEIYQLDLSNIQLAQSEGAPLKLSAGLESQLNQLEVEAQNGKGQLLSLQELTLHPATLQLDGESIAASAPEVWLRGITASSRKFTEQEPLPPMVSIDSIGLKQVEASESSVALDTITIGEILAQVRRDGEGEIASLVLPGENLGDQTAEVQEQSTESGDETTEQSQEEAAFALTLNELKLEKPAIIKFEDLSLQPELVKELTIEQLVVSEIDSLQPEEPALFSLKLKDEEYFNFLVSGQIKPFKEQVNLSFDSKATEFPLYQISPYIRDALGFDVQAGQLDLNVNGEVVDDQLDTEVVTFLRGATFDSGSGDANKENSSVIGQAAVPLDVALGMLKDDDGNIELTIPVDGDVNDPSFGMHYIFGLIAKKAVMSQAQDYLITTFLPYAQVIKVGMMAGSYALKVRFDDLAYEPGQLEPQIEQETFIQQFQALMMEKPDLQVKVCGIATPADIGVPATEQLPKAQQKQLLDFANKRAGSLKKHLVEQGVDSSRLLLCVPTFELEPEAKPRVSLSV